MILRDIILHKDDYVSLNVLDEFGNKIEIVSTDEYYNRKVISFAPVDSNTLEVLIE